MHTLLVRSPARSSRNRWPSAGKCGSTSIQLRQRMLARNRYDSMLPINNPVAGTTFPKLVASRFQAKIGPQLVNSQRLACKRVGLASLQMLVDCGTFVRMAVSRHDWIVHRLESDLNRVVSTHFLGISMSCAAYHVNQMIGNLSRLMISWVRQRKHRS